MVHRAAAIGVLALAAFLGCGGGATPAPPIAIVYGSNPAVYPVGEPIPADSPTMPEGQATSFAITPALPQGLTMDVKTGIITGTPSILGSTSHSIVASNAASSTTITFSLTVTAPKQEALGMTGDSITWADGPCYWRRYLLQGMPSLAFIGTHSDELGYSHSGEGGDSSWSTLQRVGSIPDAAWQHLLVGTNDQVMDEAGAQVTAGRIFQIVDALLARPATQWVFLGELLPDPTSDAHTAGNALVNQLLVAGAATRPQVVLVNYDAAVRSIPNWQALFSGVHPTPPVQAVMATWLVNALNTVPDQQRSSSGAGVRITNLWAGDASGTSSPLIAGWYTISLDLAAGFTPDLAITVQGGGTSITIPATAAGRISQTFFTGYERYGYTRAPWTLAVTGGTVSNILLEKMRPSQLASTWNAAGTWIDRLDPISLGEPIE